MTDTVIRSRINPALKAEATRVFSDMGLTMSEAIRLFLTQTVAQGGLPFVVRTPNAKTKLAMQEALHDEVEAVSLGQLSEDWDKACER